MNKHSIFACICCSAMLLMVSCSKQSPSKSPYAVENENQQIEQLMAQMTLDEKIGQMNQFDNSWMSDDIEADIRAGKVGSMLNKVDAETVNRLQHLAVDSSRLGIPILFARDIIHGFHTIFPIPLGQSTTWNPSLVEKAAMETAKEATQTGVRWTFSPMVDISRDPRWGRIAEGYGEDTYLTSQMGVATVRGYQGQDLKAPNSLAACVKHFAGYSATEGGRDYNATWIPEIQLREVYLPPFKACCDAGSASIMCSFNSINGLPPSANKHLCVEILRDEWQYDGLMVSDWGSVHDLIAHGCAADNREATRLGVESQIEMDMACYCYQKELKQLVEDGVVSMSQIDACVRNILRMKIRLGLFENPYPYQPTGKEEYFTPEALAVAQQACEESAVLLKNNGALPLLNNSFYKSARPKALICGPLADAQHDQNGTWVFDAIDSMTVTPMRAFCDSLYPVVCQQGSHWSRERSQANIQTLCRQAQTADVILFFAGEESMISGEAKTRAYLNLPGDQTEQIRALKATGKPVVLVVMAGRPLTIGEETDLVDAVVYAYHGGTMQGPALYQLLTGAVVPSGKLTTTFPISVGQIPFYYNRLNTGRPTAEQHAYPMFETIPVGAAQFSQGTSTFWLEHGIQCLFPFGFGLSYTTFEYSPVTLSDTILTKGGKIEASVLITNSGKFDAKEVAQLYIRDMVGSVCRPIKELKGFEKISIKSGETCTVTFTITEEDLAYWQYAEHLTPGADGAYQFGAEKGMFQLWIAPNSATGQPVSFELK